MKAFIIALGIVILMGVVSELVFNKDAEVINSVTTNTVEVEVTPDWAEDPEAVKAAQDVIQRKEWEAELETVQAEINSLTEKRVELEKNLGTY